MSFIAIATPQSLDLLDADRAVPIVHVDGPPPSFWSPERCEKFVTTLSRLAARSSVRAIVLNGPNLFVAAAGEELRKTPEGLDGLLDAVANCTKPVIAVLTGHAAGVGLELALACAARVTSPNLQLGLTSLRAARLPRPSTIWLLAQRLGVEPTGLLLTRSDQIDAQVALAMGLVDAINDDPAACARRMAATPLPFQPSIPFDLAEIEAALMGVRRHLRREAAGQTAPIAALRALEAVIKLPRRRVLADWPQMEADLADSAEGLTLRYATAGTLALETTCEVENIDALSSQLRWPLVREALHLLDEGASPAQIDRCLEAFGFKMGPFALSDRLGLERVFAFPDAGGWLTYSATLDLMIDSGRLGGDAGLGWYRPLTEGSIIRFDPEVEHLVQTSAVSQRLTRSPISDEEIICRCLNAAISASAEVLTEHPELAPSIVDAVWTTKLGFPRWKGGPLHMTAKTDVAAVVAELDAQNARRPTTGPACPLLRQWALDGRLAHAVKPSRLRRLA